jgi:hypothetical protein
MNEELRQLRIENKLLREEKKQALQDSEQYRLQMAGISTAAIGYWKEGDGIHPDYDTPALRDVAKLYAKYDELYKAQNASHGVIAGALFDFMVWLTSRKERIVLSSADQASPAVDAIRDFAKMRALSLDNAQVQTWQEALAQPEQTSGNILMDAYKAMQAMKVEGPLHVVCQCDKCKAQPQREWVGLTDEEIGDELYKFEAAYEWYQFAQAIETRLKEKNT